MNICSIKIIKSILVIRLLASKMKQSWEKNILQLEEMVNILFVFDDPPIAYPLALWSHRLGMETGIFVSALVPNSQLNYNLWWGLSWRLFSLRDCPPKKDPSSLSKPFVSHIDGGYSLPSSFVLP